MSINWTGFAQRKILRWGRGGNTEFADGVEEEHRAQIFDCLVPDGKRVVSVSDGVPGMMTVAAFPTMVNQNTSHPAPQEK